MPDALGRAVPSGKMKLQGRTLTLYRLVWWLLALASAAAIAWSWIDMTSTVGITIVRSVKGAILAVVSAILFRRRKTDPVAAMLALSLLLWTISSSVDFIDGTALPALLDRIRFFFFAMALLLFPDGRWQPRGTRAVAVAIGLTILLGIAEASGLFATNWFLPVAIGCVLSALAALFSRYRQLEEGPQKQQLKWVVLGLAIGIGLILAARAGAALDRQIAMPMGSAILLESAFQLGIVVIALGFLTSLLRYRLYDAEAAITRSAAGAALTLALVGIFAASEVTIELLGQQLFGMSMGNTAGAIAAAIAAMMLTPLHERISHWAEQHFQRDLVILKTELPSLLLGMSNGASVKRLAAAVLPRIGDAVQATRMVLMVDGRLVDSYGIGHDAAGQLLRDWTPGNDAARIHRREDHVFPLQMKLSCPLASARGWLLLGPRPDGSYYGGDDLDALDEIAPPLERTVLAVADRETEAARRNQLDKAIRQSLANLDRRIARLERLHGDGGPVSN